jgi:hypothetical protein
MFPLTRASWADCENKLTRAVLGYHPWTVARSWHLYDQVGDQQPQLRCMVLSPAWLTYPQIYSGVCSLLCSLTGVSLLSLGLLRRSGDWQAFSFRISWLGQHVDAKSSDWLPYRLGSTARNYGAVDLWLAAHLLNCWPFGHLFFCFAHLSWSKALGPYESAYS